MSKKHVLADRGQIVMVQSTTYPHCVEYWLPPVDHPEGELIAVISKWFVKDVAAVSAAYQRSTIK